MTTTQDPRQAAVAVQFLAAQAQAQQAQHPKQGQQAQQAADTKPKRPIELSIWQWTLVPVVFVALRILIASHGDADTLASLVQDLNITAVFLATILPFVSTVLVLFFVFSLLAAIEQWRTRQERRQQGQPGNEYTKSLATAIVLLPFVFVLGWYTMPVKQFIINGIIVGILLAVLLGSWFTRKLKRLFDIVGALYIVGLFIAGLIIPIAQQHLWLPRERLTIAGSQTGIVYVLSSDDRWTRYLDTADRIHIVPTQTVTGREPVQQDDWTNQTPSEGVAR